MENKKTKIAVIGRGRIGNVFYDLFLASKIFDVRSFDKKDKKNNTKDIVKDADFIFLCIPSYAIRSFISENKKFISKESVIVLLSKGLEKKTFKFPFEIIKELLPKNKFVVFGGPLMAEEVRKKKIIVGVIASSLPDFNNLRNIFGKCGIKTYLEHSFDFYGVSIGGILKNVYTLFLTALDFKKMGLNCKGFFISKIISEMQKITKILGGEEKTVLGCSGLGDLIATSFSVHSRNRKVALGFLTSQKISAESEGIHSLHSLMKISKIKKNIRKFPLLFATYKIFILKSKFSDIFDFRNLFNETD